MNTKVKAKKKYCKVKQMFTNYPNGLTITEACDNYKKLYPNESRDVAGTVCGQKSYGNFILTGEVKGTESVYKLHKPTKEEKILTKLAACKKQIENGTRTYRKFEEKLLKLRSKQKVSMNETWDLDPTNTK